MTERITQTMARIAGFPEDTVDIVTTSVTIKLGTRDVVKVLLGAPIRVHVQVASRTLVEQCGSRADTTVRHPFIQKVRTLLSRTPPQEQARTGEERL